MINIFGWLAHGIFLISQIPQIYKVCRTKSTNDLSWLWLLLFTCGNVSLVIYGIGINEKPIFIPSSFELCCNMILIVLKNKYDK